MYRNYLFLVCREDYVSLFKTRYRLKLSGKGKTVFDTDKSSSQGDKGLTSQRTVSNKQKPL